MKKTKKLWFLIAAIAMIGIAAASCVDGNETTNPCANGHDFPEWIAPICEVAGNSERACSRSGCSATDTRTDGFTALEHVMELVDGGNVIEAPTCTQTGLGETACARGCGHTEEDGVIQPRGHKIPLNWTVETAAGCTTNGLEKKVCEYDDCDDKANTGTLTQVIPAAHIFTQWQETTPATCTDAAIDTEKCSVCSELGTVTQAGHHALNHSAVGVTEATCENDGNTGTGNCIRCGTHVQGEVIQSPGHHYHDWTAPTCTMAGNNERECVNDCGTKDTRTTGYAALGHTGSITAFAATCTTAGNSALSGNCVRYDQCGHVVTGTVIPALGHDWNWATYTAGSGIRNCQRGGCSGTVGIGDTGPAGGIIFYVAPSGFTVQGYTGATGSFAEYTAYYLEAAPANASGATMRWSNTNVLIPNLSQNDSDTIDWAIGRGRLNTALIAAAHSADTVANNAAKAAAAYSQGGKDDWFLPSREELNQMYIRRLHVGIITARFWSSSQSDPNFAWYQGFDNGFQYYYLSYSNFNVRAIRAF